MGIDVSHYQGVINWEKVKAAGNSFAFAKATQGNETLDSMFRTNWQGMYNAGMIRGAYHFYIANQSPAVQALHYLEVVGALNEADLPPMLDLEDRGGAQQIGKAALIQQVHIWMKTVGDKLNRCPILYCDSSFAQEWLDESFAEYSLFIAEYGVSQPRIPSWSSGWQFWQYSSTGTVDGINGHVDQDHFVGDVDALMEFVRNSKLT